MSLRPCIQPMMLLSTAHLTAATRAQLDRWCRDIDLKARSHTSPTPFFLGATDYGWIVFCPEDTDDLPPDLAACMAYALRHGCHYLLFDSDTTIADDLAMYEEASL